VTAAHPTRTGTAPEVIAAWSATGTGGWRLSGAADTGPGMPRSVSLWANGSAALVLTGARGETIAGPGASWQALPSLPGRTATLALGQSGQVEALAVDGSRLTVWQETGLGWTRVQQITVKIPYGSSD